MTTSFLLFSLAVAVGFGALGSFIASKKGRTERFGFIIGFLFGFFGTIGLLLMKDQSKNDLEKAMDWLVCNEINKLELVGCSAARDDHHFANLFIMEKFSNFIDMKMVTNWSVFYCLDGLKTFKSLPGQTVSIITKNNDVKITTEGLKYSLKNETLNSPSQGISNVALASSFSLDVSKPVWVIVNHI